jgi:hypothetical protein
MRSVAWCAGLLLVAGTAPAADGDIKKKVDGYVAAHQGEVVAELVQALSIPDVASDTANIRKKAELLAGMFRKRGFAASLLETSANPLVYAELKNPRAERTLLVYAHYDGQPFDQKLWKQESAFKPILRDGRMEDDARTLADFATYRRRRAVSRPRRTSR